MSYPEHDKAKQRRDDLDTLTHFYDWLAAQGIQLCRWGKPRERERTCPECRGGKIDTDALTPRQRQLMERGALPEDEWPPCPECRGRGRVLEEYIDEESLAPIAVPPDRLFADYIGIDYDAYRDEKEAVYQSLRAAASS